MEGKYEPWSIRILSGVRFRLEAFAIVPNSFCFFFWGGLPVRQ